MCFSQNKNIIIQNNVNNKVYLVRDKKSTLYTKLSDFSEFDVVYDKNDVTNGRNTKWIKVEKYQNKYVLYIPCDSQYERKFIIENFHLKIKMGEIEKYKHLKHGNLGQNGFYGEYEMDTVSKNKFSLKTKVINQEPLVYQVEFSFNNNTFKENYIKIDNIRDFDIIYNQCRNNKVDEFKF
ncbi:hypothetical protein EAH69_02360 [Faecalibacter macacae]|uniref:Uncharacterized protein n=1 Tax=Faecalibacter macacae TaxID=1859289 RepID=A0A3L9MME9_9FLAO|nr:hypothetical protein EAH69_02360 [Faecalibacter macacae]